MASYDRHTLVLYTTATCNLNCKYCYIDKNPALVQIDKELDESFQGDYYTEFCKRVFPKRNQLQRVEFWGGEPTLRLDRAIHTVHNLVQIYPNLHGFFLSTNFTNVQWNEQFFGFVKMLESFAPRQFDISIQLSLDGPEHINDSQRGAGVFHKFQEHFVQMVDYSNTLPKDSNVRLRFHFKPTLTSQIIETELDTKEKIIDYYRTFEWFAYYLEEKNTRPNIVSLNLGIPNTASPSPHTTHDGKVFAEFCRMCFEIEQENQREPVFAYYKGIMPYNTMKTEYEGHMFCNGGCGTGKQNVGLLPYNYISCCHNGFTALLTSYKMYAQNNHDSHMLDLKMFMKDTMPLIEREETYRQYEENVSFMYDVKSSAKIANSANLIRLLAKAGQIEAKYASEEESIKAAQYMGQTLPFCVRDNTATTGSCMHMHTGIYRLILNGALEWIFKSSEYQKELQEKENGEQNFSRGTE